MSVHSLNTFTCIYRPRHCAVKTAWFLHELVMSFQRILEKRWQASKIKYSLWIYLKQIQKRKKLKAIQGVSRSLLVKADMKQGVA